MKLLSWLQQDTPPSRWERGKYYQLAVLLRDASTSMEEERKAQDASHASYGLMMELARSINEGAFYISVIDFQDSASIRHPATRAIELIKRMRKITPAGCTNITAGLQKAKSVMDGFMPIGEGVKTLRPVVVLFSDGQDNSDDNPLSFSERLKGCADIVTVAFGSDADEELLKKLATSPEHFYRCATGADLRRFFMKVGKTMSQTRAKKINATRALSAISGYQLEAGMPHK